MQKWYLRYDFFSSLVISILSKLKNKEGTDMLPVSKEKCMDSAVLISQKMEEILISGLSWNENVTEHFFVWKSKEKNNNTTRMSLNAHTFLRYLNTRTAKDTKEYNVP